MEQKMETVVLFGGRITATSESIPPSSSTALQREWNKVVASGIGFGCGIRAVGFGDVAFGGLACRVERCSDTGPGG